MHRRDFNSSLGIAGILSLLQTAPGQAQRPPASGSETDNSDPELSALDFVPAELRGAVLDETIPVTVDLGQYLRRAVGTGRSLVFPAGKYPFSGTLAITRGQNIRGSGRGGLGNRTLLQATGPGGPALLLDGGDSTVSNLVLQGPGANPPFRRDGIQIGQEDFTGVYTVREVLVRNFEHNIRLRGALWTSFYDVHAMLGTYGLVLDSPAGKHNSTCLFIACAFRQNQRQGFAGLNTPVRSMTFNFVGCTFEANGTERPGYPQVQPGAIGHATFNGCYFEDATGGLDALRLDESGGLNIDTCYFNGGRRHLVAAPGTSSFVVVGGGTRFIGTTGEYAIDMPGCPGVVASPTIETDKPFRLSGKGSGHATVTTADNAAWIPRLVANGNRGNTRLGHVVGRYSQIGGRIFVDCEIEIEEAGGMDGRLALHGLPIPCATDGCEAILTVLHSGFTLPPDQAVLMAAVKPGDDHAQFFTAGPRGRLPLVLAPGTGRVSLRISGNYAG